MLTTYILKIYKRAVRFIKLTGVTGCLLVGGGGLSGFSSTDPKSFRLLPSGYGPEDMVIDSLHNPARLLVSCASRRKEYPTYGEIEAFDPQNGKHAPMKRIGEPAGLTFIPHGISMTTAGEIQYLYVITHDDKKGIHPVIKYEVDGDNLIFVEMLNSKLLVSPNALQAYPDGSLVVCNDASVRGSKKEMILKKKSGNVLFYDGVGNWTIAAREIGMPAGLTGMGKRIFVSATLENKLYSYDLADGVLTSKKLVCNIKGPDNIRVCKNRLIVTSHTKMMKFVGHVKNKNHPSPSLVLSVDPHTGASTRLFYDNGEKISTASVGLIWNNQLIIGQIFEPFIGILDPAR